MVYNHQQILWKPQMFIITTKRNAQMPETIGKMLGPPGRLPGLALPASPGSGSDASSYVGFFVPLQLLQGLSGDPYYDTTVYVILYNYVYTYIYIP